MRKSIPTILETKQLPEFTYLGLENIVVPQTRKDFAAAVSHLSLSTCVGFDTESKPVFEKGQVSDGPHLVQFATEDRAYIFQLCNLESHNPLLALLSDENIKKVGFDLASDRKYLIKKFGVIPRGLVDIRQFFNRKDYSGTVGVRAAVAILFKEKFQKSKHITTSNWACKELSSNQLLYAANDAYAALRVYLKLQAELICSN